MDRDWTDKRTDDLADRVGRFEANLDKRFDKIDAKMDLINRTIWVGIIAAAAVKFLFG